MSESDGVEQALRGPLRVILAVAGQAGQQGAMLLQERIAERQRESSDRALELQRRLDVERQAARAELAGVGRDTWWDTATPEQIGRAWQVAQTWKQIDPDAAQAADVVVHQVRDRFDVDVNNSGADAATVAEMIRKGTVLSHEGAVASAEAATQRTASTLDELAAARVLTEQDQAPDVDELDVDALNLEDLRRELGDDFHDSAQRRGIVANCLEAAGIDKETVGARILADAGQATSPAKAVGATKKKPKARKAKVSQERGRIQGISR